MQSLVWGKPSLGYYRLTMLLQTRFADGEPQTGPQVRCMITRGPVHQYNPCRPRHLYVLVVEAEYGTCIRNDDGATSAHGHRCHAHRGRSMQERRFTNAKQLHVAREE